MLSTEIKKDLAVVSFLVEVKENNIMGCLVCDSNGWRTGSIFLELLGITGYEQEEVDYVVDEVFEELNEKFCEYEIDRIIGYANGGIFLEPVNSEVWEFDF